MANLSNEIWRLAMLPRDATIGQAAKCLNDIPTRIVLVTDNLGVLEGTVSDGDIRRGLLKGFDLASPISAVLHKDALVVTPDINRGLVMQLMAANKIYQVPIVDDSRRVVGLYLWEDITRRQERPNLFVIMAGGKGVRLRPYTENCPKPMLQVAGKPILEHIIDRAKLEGFVKFALAINYLGHVIEDYFSDGERLGVQITYLRERSPLGTAGALGLINPTPDDSFLVTNGDVIADIRYSELLDFHSQQSADATMAVRAYEWQHPFGVVKTRGNEIIGFEEKPIVRTHINAGVYALQPSTLQRLEPDLACDMPTMFSRVRESGGKTVVFPMHESWLDIGRPDDLKQANESFGG
jgi:dTDP-glucose pyrophosphorylase